MKKLVITVSLAALLVACGDKTETTQVTTETKTVETTTTTQAPTPATPVDKAALVEQAKGAVQKLGGTLKGELARGEHKSLQTDRVILQPGPDAEVAIVNQIYRWFVTDNLTELEIAERLNTQKIRTDLGRDWTRATVREVLSNEKYIGNNVYNRRSFKLKKNQEGE